jgi:hypothetical protein
MTALRPCGGEQSNFKALCFVTATGRRNSDLDDAIFNEEVLNEFEKLCSTPESRLLIIPGKEALGAINKYTQDVYGANITATSVVDMMTFDEVSPEMKRLVTALGTFASAPYVERERSLTGI